ncbi:hypothetical protein M427DRAFT_30950 [Gonapodya prolifera JEL478]|uniref:L domain-like protein n=1 Tax=Gonapodya prolifera (strain JEL478) TaxID=1344416 RepID=A0A139AJ56_GONPJ|nr:hypothetical protein M427DRAFT_30950 [Gonapodya prolifera JEL478]|eukprot:KXS16841.1 hypothetical protein M427DRAFT_30950 [Gonapodya prolifera JEL478]
MRFVVILLSLISLYVPRPTIAATIADDCAPWEIVLLLAGLQPDWPIGQCCTPSNTSASGSPRFFVFGCSTLNGTLSGNVSTATPTTTARLVEVSWSPTSAYSLGRAPVILNLTELRKLDLHRAGLTGTLPGINNLTKLQYLDLSSNPGLSGPLGNLSSLTSLTYLDVSNTSLTGSVENAIPLNITLCNLSATRLLTCSNATIPRICTVQQCCGSDCAPSSTKSSFFPTGLLNPAPPPAVPSSSSSSGGKGSSLVFIIVGLVAILVANFLICAMLRRKRTPRAPRPSSDQEAVELVPTYTAISPLDAPPPYSMGDFSVAPCATNTVPTDASGADTQPATSRPHTSTIA